MATEENPITVFDDLRTHTAKFGKNGPAFEMVELSGGKWEKFAQYLKFISRYENETSDTIESGLKTADIINHFKKEAVKIILEGAEDAFLEKEVPPMRLIKLIEIQKELNGIAEAEKFIKNQVDLAAVVKGVTKS